MDKSTMRHNTAYGLLAAGVIVSTLSTVSDSTMWMARGLIVGSMLISTGLLIYALALHLDKYHGGGK